MRLTLRKSPEHVVAAIDVKRDALFEQGCPYLGKFIDVSDQSRTDTGGMGATAGLASLGVVAWPDDYARGWIATDNERIPLPTPADGLALATRVGEWYAAARQHARDLKDQALAPGADLSAIDIQVGWPS